MDTAHMASDASSPEPAIGLRAVRALRELTERLEELQVANARDQDWTWQEIARLLGVSRQAVHKKYTSSRVSLQRKE